MVILCVHKPVCSVSHITMRGQLCKRGGINEINSVRSRPHSFMPYKYSVLISV